MNKIMVAGHRGYKKNYPENTLVSFNKAIEAGVDMIEFDVHLTKDKKAVILHDDTVDRTTNGSGFVRELTLDELKSLDAGSWFSSEYTGQKIPTLEELLDSVSDNKKLLFNVEIKEKTLETADITVDTLRRFNIIDRSVLTCFDGAILKYVWQTYGLRCQGFPGFMMRNFEEGVNGTYSMLYSVGIEKKYLSHELVGFFRSINVLPWAYCIDDEETTLKIIEYGIMLITCDDPVPPLKILREKGCHE